MKLYLAIALAFASLPALSDERPPATLWHEHAQSSAGACRDALPGGDPRLRPGAIGLHNTHATQTVGVLCSPVIDMSPNGTQAFGAILSNHSTSNKTISCTAFVSTAGSGPVAFQRHLIVSPGGNSRIAWYASDMMWNTLKGGQVGFRCELPPGTAVSWIWTQAAN